MNGSFVIPGLRPRGRIPDAHLRNGDDDETTRGEASRSARSCALRSRIHGVDRLTRGHEQAVALGAAEGDVAAHLGQADAAEQLAFRRPYRHAAIADVAAGIACGPDIPVD